jgi:hypothetical protein
MKLILTRWSHGLGVVQDVEERSGIRVLKSVLKLQLERGCEFEEDRSWRVGEFCRNRERCL